MTQKSELKSAEENSSPESWDRRFASSWELDGGCERSRYFYELLANHLPPLFVERALAGSTKVIDWGCALGDGLALLAQKYPWIEFEGCDHSATAVQMAQKRYPQYKFSLGPLSEQVDQAQIVITSNTLNYCEKPWECLKEIGRAARDFVIVFVPFDSDGTQLRHPSRFTWQNVQVEHGDLRLCFANVIDANPDFYSGKQLLLIYSKDCVSWSKDLFRLSALELGKHFSLSQAVECPKDSFLAYILQNALVEWKFSASAPALKSRFFVEELVQHLLVERRKAVKDLRHQIFKSRHHLKELSEQCSELRRQYDTKVHEFNLVILSKRFKIGEALCESLKAVKDRNWKVVNAYCQKFGRQALKKITGREWKVSHSTEAGFAAIHNPELSIIPNALPNRVSVFCQAEEGLVSIVLPVYNHRRFLRESIRSVLTQSYHNLELIVVNDGSTDSIESIVREFAADSRLRYVRHLNNKRLPNALNTGMTLARGEFLTWTSADNLLRDDAISALVAYLQANRRVDMVFTGFELIDGQGKTIPSWTGHKGGKVCWNDQLDALNNTFNFIGACFLYRHYAAKVVGGYNSLFSGAEDYDYWMRLNSQFNIERFPDPEFTPYLYRFHEDSLTGVAREMKLERLVARLQELDLFRQTILELPVDLIPLDPRASELCRVRPGRGTKSRSKQLAVQSVEGLLVSQGMLNRFPQCVEAILKQKRIGTVFGLIVEGELTQAASIVQAFDFVLVNNRKLLNVVPHRRSFFVDPIERSGKFISKVCQAIVIENSSDPVAFRDVPLAIGFESGTSEVEAPLARAI